MDNIKKIFKEGNFIYFFAAFFFSELGGFLTNTCILLHINNVTDGDLFYLGLSQALFVLPLSLGTLVGGGIGESFNKKNIMLICEVLNIGFVFLLVLIHENILAVIALRAVVVFLAGVYNPSRQSIVQELLDRKHLKSANSSFTGTFALFHALSPIVSVYLYKTFGGLKEVFILNVITYSLGALFLLKLRYKSSQTLEKKVRVRSIYNDILNGMVFVRSRPDLFALLLNFLLAGTFMGVFYPTVLPYIKGTYGSSNGEQIFAYMSSSLAIGAILGAFVSAVIMRFLSKGKILTIFAFTQALILLIWTQVNVLSISYGLLFFWGMGSMVTITTYINYIQLNVQNKFRTRTFSILDQSVSLSSCFGGLLVMIIGNSMSAKETLTFVAGAGLILMFLRLTSKGLKELYKMSN